MSLVSKKIITRLQAPVIEGAQNLAVLEIPEAPKVTEEKDKVSVLQEESESEFEEEEELEEGEIREEPAAPAFTVKVDFEQEELETNRLFLNCLKKQRLDS